MVAALSSLVAFSTTQLLTPLPVSHTHVTQAVEPSMKVENKDKGILAFAPVALVAAVALIAIPLLPTLFAANPDQA